MMINVLFIYAKRKQTKQFTMCHIRSLGGMQAGKLRGKAPFIPYSLRIKQFFDKWNGCRVDKDWSLPLTG